MDRASDSLEDQAPTANQMRIEPGKIDDYRRLVRFHYKACEPATVVRAYRMVLDHQTVHERLTGVADRMSGERERGELVGVVLLSMPHLGCAMRNVALPGRYTGMSRSEAGKLVNRELRCISRVIIDPRFRGLGVAVRLVRHVIAHARTTYVEALAVMGRVNPFFERAGMQRFDPTPSAPERRFLATLDESGLHPTDLLDAPRLQLSLGELSDEEHANFMLELNRFAIRCKQRHDPPPGEMQLSFRDQLKRARRCISGAPVYYLARSGSPAGSSLSEALNPHDSPSD